MAIVLFVDHQRYNTTELLNWPPLRVYDRFEGVQWLPVADLVWLESDVNYTWLHWADGQRVLLPRTLKWFEGKLPATWFLRLHRHCLVNRRYIERVEVTGSSHFYLVTGRSLPVSRRRWPLVRRQMAFQPPTSQGVTKRNRMSINPARPAHRN